MIYIQDFLKYNLYNIILFVIIMITIIVIFNIFDINFIEDTHKELQKIVTIEAFEKSDYSNGLCSLYSSNLPTLEKKCNSLNEKNCKVTSCCGWLNKTTCVAGNKSGPNYHSKDDKNISVSSWEIN